MSGLEDFVGSEMSKERNDLGRSRNGDGDHTEDINGSFTTSAVSDYAIDVSQKPEGRKNGLDDLHVDKWKIDLMRSNNECG